MGNDWIDEEGFRANVGIILTDGESTLQEYLFDAGIVELFLRENVRHFTVNDCLQLASDSGLTFQGWLDNFYYYPDGQIPASRGSCSQISRGSCCQSASVT